MNVAYELSANPTQAIANEYNLFKLRYRLTRELYSTQVKAAPAQVPYPKRIWTVRFVGDDYRGIELACWYQHVCIFRTHSLCIRNPNVHQGRFINSTVIFYDTFFLPFFLSFATKALLEAEGESDFEYYRTIASAS